VCGAGVASGDLAAWPGGGGGDDGRGVSGVVSDDGAATLPRDSSPFALLRPCIYIDIFDEYIYIFYNNNIK
jgi:hypothetical protein